jgi:hypothetical protein
MGLFSREAPCDVCGATLAKKDIQHFDPTWRRERKTEDSRRRLCAGCLSAALGEYLRNFSHRALAIAPTPEGGGYSFAPLDIRTRSFVWSDELKEQVRRLLPDADAKCRRCGRAARFTWCGLDIFEGTPYELHMRERGQFAEEPLCGTCAATEFDRVFRASSAVFQEVIPPADGDGVLTPAEC